LIVFIPIYDDNRLKHIEFQYVTLFLIALNVACFVFEWNGIDRRVIASFALVPTELLAVNVYGGHAGFSSEALAVPEVFTLVTYMFFHGDLLHIAGNMLFLWVFGDNVEDACGHWRYLLLYLACGVLAGLAHVVMQPQSVSPLVGASGAVAGVISAYLVLHPRVRVWVIAFKFLPLRISAVWLLSAWIVLQVMMLFLPQTGPIAWWAHIGGIISGAVLVVILRRKGVVLFDQNLPQSSTV
jgi:membrane associated rhomboid family serine protease